MHIVSLVARYFLCLLPYITLVSNKAIIYHITGPITIPPFGSQHQTLISTIAFIQFIRIFYTPLATSLIFLLTTLSLLPPSPRISSFINSMTIKHLIVIFFKLWVIFYEMHRLKYYLHVFFIELFIILVNVLADVVSNEKVGLVMDVVLVDGLNRVAMFYEITRTFNPNFGLYFFGNNLLTLICFMLEADKKQVLYVRHDIYRIMIVTFAYLFLFSLFQSSVTCRPLLIFLLTAYFFLMAIQSFANHSMASMKSDISSQTQPRINNVRRGDDYYYRQQNTEQESFGSYIRKMRHNYAFLYFIILVIVNIGMEIIFIERDSINGNKESLIGEQAVRQSFTGISDDGKLLHF